MSNVFKEFRERFGFTREEAAEVIGVCSKKWGDLENEKSNKSNLIKYENLIKFFNHDLNKPFDKEKTKIAYFKPLTTRQVLRLTGFSDAAFTSSRKRHAVSPLLNTLINAAILAIDEEKNRIILSKKRLPLPKMELKTYPAPSIEIVPKKTRSIADQIADIESRNQELEGENAELKLTISTLELQIQQLSKENELLKAEANKDTANKDTSAPITEDQRKYLKSIVIRFAEKSGGPNPNPYYWQGFYADIFKEVSVKSLDGIKTTNQWLKAVHYAKERCKAIGLHIESFPVQLSIVS